MIELKNILINYKKDYYLKNINLKFKNKSLTCIYGKSGSGKSDLLDLLYFRKKPLEGEVIIDGVNLANLSKDELQDYRKNIGIIYQDLKLFKNKTVYENLAFILEIKGEDSETVFQRVKDTLKIVGIEEKIAHSIENLSKSDLQKVCIARAMVAEPELIIADEPFTRLDTEEQIEILNIFKRINVKFGVTIILASKKKEILKQGHSRFIEINSGEVILDENLAGENSESIIENNYEI